MQSVNLHNKHVTTGLGRRELGACTIAETHPQRSQCRTVKLLVKACSAQTTGICTCCTDSRVEMLAEMSAITFMCTCVPLMPQDSDLELHGNSSLCTVWQLMHITYCREQLFRKDPWSCQRKKRYMPLQSVLQLDSEWSRNIPAWCNELAYSPHHSKSRHGDLLNQAVPCTDSCHT